MELWQLKAGLALVDWRWCGRLANIDSTNLLNQSGATDLTEGMIDASCGALGIPDQTYGWAKLTGEMLAEHVRAKDEERVDAAARAERVEQLVGALALAR